MLPNFKNLFCLRKKRLQNNFFSELPDQLFPQFYFCVPAFSSSFRRSMALAQLCVCGINFILFVNCVTIGFACDSTGLAIDEKFLSALESLNSRTAPSLQPARFHNSRRSRFVCPCEGIEAFINQTA